MLLLNVLGKFVFCSLIGICGGNDGGVPFFSSCGINNSSIGFGRNGRFDEPKFGVVTPLPVDWIELFIVLLFVLLLFIGAVALTELFSEAGGRFAADDVVRPDMKSVNVES